jgi:phosphohistidine phosphatase
MLAHAMARQLWLLRHAEAEPHGTRPDELRSLTVRGERQAATAGRALERIGARIDLALVSPKLRAAQTAELAAQACDECLPALTPHPPAAFGYDAEQALSDLAGAGSEGHLLVVGHEPDLAGVVGALTGASIDLKKAGLAVVRLHGAGGELVLLLRPAELALIAGEPASDV